MKAPEPWHVPHGRAPESELRRLNRRFRAISRTLDRAQAFRRLDRWSATLACIVIGGIALFWGALSLSPWPPIATLRHVAAFPSCDAARALGMAPARSGDPGYWQRHDRDQDGISCEPWPRD